MKTELTTQWEHTEKASEKIEGLGKKNTDLEKERGPLQTGIEELEQKLRDMDGEWNEGENSKKPILLQRADDLGSRILPVFGTHSGFPGYRVKHTNVSDPWFGILPFSVPCLLLT